MKQLFTLLFTALSVGVFAQNEVKVSEDIYSYSIGAKNSIIVTVPHGRMDVVEKELKSEMKSWGGKYGSSKGESKLTQASMKAMGSKPFDAYAKIYMVGDVMKVAVAIDLGGAFMTSTQHSSNFTTMTERLRAFAVKASQESIAEEMKIEQKMLGGLEKEHKDLEKEKENLLKSIEDYKKKIADTEKKIEENVSNQSKKKEEITKQTEKVGAIEKKKSAVK